MEIDSEDGWLEAFAKFFLSIHLKIKKKCLVCYQKKHITNDENYALEKVLRCFTDIMASVREHRTH